MYTYVYVYIYTYMPYIYICMNLNGFRCICTHLVCVYAITLSRVLSFSRSLSRTHWPPVSRPLTHAFFLSLISQAIPPTLTFFFSPPLIERSEFGISTSHWVGSKRHWVQGFIVCQNRPKLHQKRPKYIKEFGISQLEDFSAIDWYRVQKYKYIRVFIYTYINMQKRGKKYTYVHIPHKKIWNKYGDLKQNRFSQKIFTIDVKGICIYTNICMYTYVCIYIHIHIYMFVYKYICFSPKVMYTHMHTHASTQMYIYIFTRKYTYIYIHMYIHIYIYIYIYI